MKIKNIILLFVLFANQIVCASSKPQVLAVLENNLAQLSLDGAPFLTEGMILTSYRNKVPTGKLKIIQIEDDQKAALASVLEDSTPLSHVAFKDYPTIMAQDTLEVSKQSLTIHKEIVPLFELSYFDLFLNPKGDTLNYELSREGKENLKKIMDDLKDKRFNRLLVQGHTDHNGDAKVNQTESYQRALTIKRYLVEYLNVDNSRILAVGMGEDEPVDESLAFGYIRNNRRITLKPF